VNVALIGDVHANLPALEAVLDHARRQETAAVWNVGDFIGYGAYPKRVIERLGRENAVSIAGNYDLRVLDFKKKRKKWRRNSGRSRYPVSGPDAAGDRGGTAGRGAGCGDRSRSSRSEGRTTGRSGA